MRIKGKYSWLKHLDFMIVDLVSLMISFTIAYRIKFGDFGFVDSETWMRLFIVIGLLNLTTAFFVNPYSGIFRRRYYMEILTAFKLTVINLLAASLFFYLLKIGAAYSRKTLLATYALYFFVSVVFKYAWKKLLLSGVLKARNTTINSLFVIGETSTIKTAIKDAMAGDFILYKVVGIYLVDDDSTLDQVEGIPILKQISCAHYILNNHISDVLVTVSPTMLSNEEMNQLSSNGITIYYNIDSIIGFHPEDQMITSIGVHRTLAIGAFTFTPNQAFYFMVKRVFDIICGLVGLIFLIPITLIVKLSYVLSGDTAKIFYRQKRVGLNGKPIRIWKFRSMVPNAEEVLKELLKDEKYRQEWEENQKFENDPRITKVGKILRKTSVDELPQLLNVLIGEMSLVGPRPLVEGELSAHNGLKLYERVKPGITGWWGCNGRSNIDYKERLELEYYYVKNCSLYLDILCIIRTVLVVLKRDGAQ